MQASSRHSTQTEVAMVSGGRRAAAAGGWMALPLKCPVAASCCWLEHFMHMT